MVWRRQCRHERGYHDFVRDLDLAFQTDESAQTKLSELTCRAMILWISQSGSDEYEYQLTV
jgi:hypothetical protein